MTLKLCQVIDYYTRNIFMEKSYRKCTPKARPRPFLILVNNPKQLVHARNYFRNKILLKRIIKKPLKS